MQKLVPKILTDKQKQNHLFVCQDLVDHLTTEVDILGKVITGDKTWAFIYDPET